MSTHPDSRLPRHTLFVKGLSTYRGENCAGGIISGETGLAHAGTVIDNKGSNFVFLLVVASYKRENGLVDWIEIRNVRSGTRDRRQGTGLGWVSYHLRVGRKREERAFREEKREKEWLAMNTAWICFRLKAKELCP